MEIEELFNKKLYELNIVFRPLQIETIQLGRLIAFELIKDREGVRLYTSENIQEELGYSLEDFYLNLRVKDFLDLDTFIIMMNKFNDKTMKLRSDFVSEFKFKDSSGNDRWGDLYINILYKKRDWHTISGYILDSTVRKIEEEKERKDREKIDRINDYIEDRIRDEVDRKLVEDRAEESKNRHVAVSETIERIAHQWRQPLNVVSLLMQDLYFKVNLGTLYPPEASSDELKEIFAEKYNDLYEKVNSHIQYLSDTVNDFRRHMSQNTKVEKDYFNVKNFFEEIDEFIRPSIERMNIKLFNRVKLDFIEVLGVENNLKQVILNIIHNAEDIFRERNIKDREIIINAFFSEEKLNITISDNAGGIPRDVLPQIFDPYFTTKHETQGTGLGLYMSRELILKGFGGEIYATNRSHCSNCRDFCSIKSMQSEGACFTIEIPEYREI